MTRVINERTREELETLEWLNAHFFERVLRHSEQELDAELIVQKVKLSTATRKIDHYASVILRAEVSYQQGGVQRIKSMIVKTMPEFDENSYKKKLLGESKIFETEIGMYTEVLPSFESILRSIGDTTLLKPNCLYHSLSPRKLIIFEDLQPQGYRAVGDGPISLAEAKCAYMKLAKWHAISYKLLSENPHCFDKYRASFLTESNILEMDFMTSSIDNFIEMLEADLELKFYASHFKAFKKDWFKKFIDCFTEFIEPSQGRSCHVLCHGDFNYKNIMVKNNPYTRELLDVILLDFQLSWVGNMATDILYSFFMLLDVNLRHHYHELLYFYFTHFTTTLKLIGYHGPKPRIMEMHEHIKKLKHFELCLLVTCLPLRYALNDGTYDCDLMVASAEYRKTIYKHKGYIKEVKEILPAYLKNDYFRH